MAKDRAEPVDTGEDDDDQGSWHLRSAGAWVFALALWFAGLGGTVLFAQDGVEVALARWHGIAGTVTIDTCAHTKSYALCYGPFDAANGSVHVKRLELRTLHHDQPGRREKTWLRSRSADHAWASDVSPWGQLIPATPFALLAVIQSVWITLSWRAGRRRRRLRKLAAAAGPAGFGAGPPVGPAGFGAGPPVGPGSGAGPSRPAPPGLGAASAALSSSEPTAVYPVLPAPTTSGHLPAGAPYPPPAAEYPPAPAAIYPPAEPTTGLPPGPPSYPSATGRALPPGGAAPPAPRIYRSGPPRPPGPPHVEFTQPHQHPDGTPVGASEESDGWQDRPGSRGTAAPPGQTVPPAAPPPPLPARRRHWERPEHG